jgi:hypothetical protein
MRNTPQLPEGEADADAARAHATAVNRRLWESAASSSLFVRVNAVAILVAGAGLFLPRVTAVPADGFGLVTLRTGYGQVFGLLLLLVGATLACWCVARSDRLTAVLLFVVWLGLLATAAFEVVRVAAANADQFGLSNVGIGLYCNIAGAAVGTVAALIEAVRQWTAGRPQAEEAGWLPWVVAVGAAVLTLAAVATSGQLAGRDDGQRSAAGAFGPRTPLFIGAHGTPRSTEQSPVEGHHSAALPSATTTPTSASNAAPATFGTGISAGSGDTGNSGSWGMEGGLATFWPGYTGAPGSFYIWPGYLGPATNTGATGSSGLTVTGASGLTGSGSGTGTGTGTTVPTSTTTTVPPPPAPAGNGAGVSTTTVPDTTSNGLSGGATTH